MIQVHILTVNIIMDNQIMCQKTIIQIRLLFCVFLLTSIFGCQRIRDQRNSQVSSFQNRYKAQQAWSAYKKECKNRNFSRDYARGFNKGYVNVIEGKEDSPEALPPRIYWSTWNQNPKGEYRQQNWFNGYDRGVLAAQNAKISSLNHSESNSQSPYKQNETIITQKEHQSPIQELTAKSEQPPFLKVIPPETSPLLPITSSKKEGMPANSLIELHPQTYKSSDNLSDFHPFDDDDNELYASENLDIEAEDIYVNENAKASNIEIRPASGIKQASYEEESSRETSTQDTYTGIKIRPAYRKGMPHFEESTQHENSDHFDEPEYDWSMPKE